MNFTLKLSLSEVIKNKSKVLIAIIVTLILFMSAFALCNISAALPENFYGYYEEYMPGTIGISIVNADANLYNNSNRYFEQFTPDFSKACNNFSLIFEGEEQLPYSEETDNDGNIISTKYFNNVLLESGNIDYDAENYQTFFDRVNGGSGSVWDSEKTQEGIWISDIAATNLFANKTFDEVIGQSLQYKFGKYLIELEVKGIFNGKMLKQYVMDQSGSYIINDYLCFITETSAKKILFESNTTFNAYGVVGKIDKLYDVYNDLHNRYSLSEGAAFGLISHVKNAQVICMIVGVIMIVCGIIIMLNFINMIISQNIKHISLLRILGTSTFRIMMAYYIIFVLMVTIVCIISWMTLPLYNYFVSLYCAGLGYPFTTGINYLVVLGVFGICYLIITLVMLVKWRVLDNTSPARNIAEED